MSASMRDTESLSMSALSLVLIAPQEERRRALAKALSGPQASIARELTRYPQLDDLPKIMEADHDVVVVDLDADPERALDVVETICAANPSVTVIAYSAHANADLLVRCMRAGAREFLAEPLLPSAVAEALVRASVRREEVRRHKRVLGKLFVFMGAKGGSGVTTVASNFAVALAKVPGNKAALLDLDLQLGDAAMNLGVTSKFSVLDALESPNRLDADFLSVLLGKHGSGLEVLAAPDTIPALQPSTSGLERLIHLARENYGYVVVDAGSHSADMYETLFDMATAVYLVTQISVTELRNSNRMIARYFSGAESSKLEIVINRHHARNLEIDEEAITKALTRPAKWRVPNDYVAVRRAQNAGTPLASDNSPLGRAFAEMAKAVSVQPAAAVVPKKKKFGLF